MDDDCFLLWARPDIPALRALGASNVNLGCESHVPGSPPDPELVLKRLDALHSAGIGVRVTEFDVDTPDAEMYGDYLRDYLTAMFSHPAVDGFMMWGFMDAEHWKKNAPLFNSSWGPKPGLVHWRELLFHRWWSNEVGKTGADGTATFSVFKGAHNVTVLHQGATHVATAWVGDDGGHVEVRV